MAQISGFQRHLRARAESAAGVLIVRTFSRPLGRITVAAVQVTKGEYGTEVDLRKSNDEIGLLAESFNEMSRKMAGDIEQLAI